MSSGFSYLVVQLGLALVVALVLGVLGGRYLWPGRAGRLAGSGLDDAAVQELRVRLASSEATVQELRNTVTTVTDHKDAEMGWLESRAIQAMDSLVLAHEERVQALQTQVENTTAQARQHERDLEAERRHTLRLQATLVERDERIATLSEQLSEKERLLSRKNGVPAPVAD